MMRWIALLLFAANAQLLFGCVTNAIPFGVATNQLIGKTAGDTFIINDAGVGSGKEVKIDLANYPNLGAWDADMLALGCGCQTCTGNYPIITGNSHVSTDFNAMGAGAVFIMPLIDQFNIQANIVGFVLVKLLNSSGSGSNWAATLQLLSAPFPLNDLTVDSDGDGQSDFQEFYTGTNPTSSASFFGITSIALEGGDLRISWMTAAGKTNALQRSGDLTNNFSIIFTVTNAVGTATNYLDLGAITNLPAQFYRVRLVP